MTNTRSGALRQRMSREDRSRQLIDTSREILRIDGADALTLGRLADRAGVSRPVVYDHFKTRNGLLKALFEDFDRQRAIILQNALACSEPNLADRARVIAKTFIDCVFAEAQEIPGVSAALLGSPEMEECWQGYQQRFTAQCRAELQQFAGDGSIREATLWAMLGAAGTLSDAVVRRAIGRENAEEELIGIISSSVSRD